MSVQASTPAMTVSATVPRRLARLRRSSLVAFVLLVIQYALGMYVNLYVTIPRADHGRDMGSVIANGPAMLSVHGALGLLLTLAALGTLVQAILLRHAGAIVVAAVALFAMAFAAVAGSGFASSGQASQSMAMAVMTGIGLLCYGVLIYLLRPSAPQAQPGQPSSPGDHPVQRG